jgi:aminoglycoside phosphotransferase (APT) family kinase protein
VSDNTTWILRLVRGGKVRPEYADEKVAVEVEVLALLRHRTSIPVPAVHCWGLAADNPLGLGPYILMDFIEGVSANAFLSHPDEDTRILREDIAREKSSSCIDSLPASTCSCSPWISIGLAVCRRP